MLKTGYQKIIVLLLLLAFTSQTLATVSMTCELEKATTMPSAVLAMAEMSMTEMDHMHHDMSTMPVVSDDTQQHSHQKSNCCKTMGDCVFGGCTLATASNSMDFLLAKLDSTAEDFYSSVAPKPLSSSFYRPPIFC